MSASPSRFSLYIFSLLTLWSNFHFLSARIALTSLLCYSLTSVNFLFVLLPDSLWLPLYLSQRLRLFSFLRFGSAKVETFFYFPKLFFLSFILSFVPRFSSSLFSLSGLQRCESYFNLSSKIFTFLNLFLFAKSSKNNALFP